MQDLEGLLTAARGGDARAFASLTDGHRRELRVHCYRILGSIDEAEDMLQETFLRAWQRLPQFEGRGSLRGWLYKIATNVCLDALDHRRVRTLPQREVPAGDPRAPLPPPTEHAWIEPVPDEWLAAAEVGPDAQLTEREGVALAFLAMLQTLPGKQRAALVLRDVLGFSANETADMLDISVAAANSALQRARETIDAEREVPPSRRVLGRDEPAARDLLARFVRAWEAGDASGVVACLTANATFSMPPLALWLKGRDAIRAFLEGVLFQGDAAGRFRVLLTTANGAPALATYERDERGYRPAALDVLRVESDGVAEVVAFLAMDPKLSFARFGVPERLEP